MRGRKSRVGLGSFLLHGTLSLSVLAGIILAYYLYVPAIAMLTAGLLVLTFFVVSADHVPIGMHARIAYRYGVRSGEITPPRGVPKWIVRFASEPDPGLLLISVLGTFVASLVLMVADLFMPGRFLSRAVVDLSGMWQLFFVPHLIGLTTWSLIGFRDSLMRAMYKLDRAQAVSA